VFTEKRRISVGIYLLDLRLLRTQNSKITHTQQQTAKPRASATLTQPHPSQQAPSHLPFGRPPDVEGFSPPHSEGYFMSKASPHILWLSFPAFW